MIKVEDIQKMIEQDGYLLIPAAKKEELVKMIARLEVIKMLMEVL